MKLQEILRTLHRGFLKKEKMQAVHDDDLEGFLGSLDLLNEINSGKKKCKFCKEVISVNNIGVIFPDSGNINIICDNPICMKKFLEYYKGEQ